MARHRSGSGESYLGIDFHRNNVKVVELRNEHGRSRLVTYGYVDLSLEPSTIVDDRASRLALAKVIQQVCRQARTTTTRVVTALPAHSIFSSILNLSPMKKKDLPAAIEREAQKIIPLPLAKMVLDWKVLETAVARQIDGDRGQTPPRAETKPSDVPADRSVRTIAPEKKPNYTKILLTAAPKDLVRGYIDIFNLAKLDLLTLDTAPFALIRSLVGNDQAAVMIVDIGTMVTDVSVVVAGVPIVNRSVQVGGLTITKAIAQTAGLELERAESLKYDLSLDAAAAGSGLPAVLATALEPITDELKFTLNAYKQHGLKPIEKVILTGGSSLLINLPNYLSQQLNLKMYRGNPWARVIYPEPLKPVLDQIGARFSVALGLAMRYIQ